MQDPLWLKHPLLNGSKPCAGPHNPLFPCALSSFSVIQRVGSFTRMTPFSCWGHDFDHTQRSLGRITIVWSPLSYVPLAACLVKHCPLLSCECFSFVSPSSSHKYLGWGLWDCRNGVLANLYVDQTASTGTAPRLSSRAIINDMMTGLSDRTTGKWDGPLCF